MATPSAHAAVATPTLREATAVWWRIGWLGFGGPAGQIALMHRELVEQRRWIGETRFLHALNYCMVLPGPEAQQLATYVGWLMHGARGGLVAGTLFVLPGIAVIGVLAALYVVFGALPAAQALFYGLKAAVLAVVVHAVVRVGRRALRGSMHVAMAAAAFIALQVFAVPFPLVIVAAGVVGLLAHRVHPRPVALDDDDGDGPAAIDAITPSSTPAPLRTLATAGIVALGWIAPVAIAWSVLGRGHVLTQQGLLFGQAAVVTFGGAYAVLAYIAQRAVEDFGWLSPGEMVDGLALAETTPGPLVLVLQFVGFIAAYRNPGMLDPWLAAVLGALLTSWMTFVPSLFFVFVGAPYVERLRRNAWLQAALSAITAAVVGVILSLSAWFALHTLFARTQRIEHGPVQADWPAWSSLDPFALALCVVAFLMLHRRWPLLRVLALCAVAGLLGTFAIP